MSDKPIFSVSVIKAAEELTTRFPFKRFYEEQVFDTCQVIQEALDANYQGMRAEMDALNDEIAMLQGELNRRDDEAGRAIEEAKHDAYAEAEREMRAEMRDRGDW